MPSYNINDGWPWEQKGCRRNSRETKDHLLIMVDKLLMFLTKCCQRNLQTQCLMHSWVIKVLAMYKMAENIGGFLLKSVTTSHRLGIKSCRFARECVLCMDVLPSWNCACMNKHKY